MVAFNRYNPTPQDIAWAEFVISMLKDGGIWGAPMNNSHWKIDKKKKEFWLLEGDVDFDFFNKTTALFAKFGYKVLDKRGRGIVFDEGSGKT